MPNEKSNTLWVHRLQRCREPADTWARSSILLTLLRTRMLRQRFLHQLLVSSCPCACELGRRKAGRRATDGAWWISRFGAVRKRSLASISHVTSVVQFKLDTRRSHSRNLVSTARTSEYLSRLERQGQVLKPQASHNF